MGVTGTTTLTGDFTANGECIFGSDANDSITLNGKVGDVTMNNGATIVNTDANTLTITEATTAINGDLTVSGGDVTFGNGQNGSISIAATMWNRCW